MSDTCECCHDISKPERLLRHMPQDIKVAFIDLMQYVDGLQDERDALKQSLQAQQATITRLERELAEVNANVKQLEKELFDLRVSEYFHYVRMIDAERQKEESDE